METSAYNRRQAHTTLDARPFNFSHLRNHFMCSLKNGNFFLFVTCRSYGCICLFVPVDYLSCINFCGHCSLCFGTRFWQIEAFTYINLKKCVHVSFIGEFLLWDFFFFYIYKYRLYLFSHCVVEWLGVISVLVESEGLRGLGSLGCRGRYSVFVASSLGSAQNF